jgi:hypothetical protein
MSDVKLPGMGDGGRGRSSSTTRMRGAVAVPSPTGPQGWVLVQEDQRLAP